MSISLVGPSSTPPQGGITLPVDTATGIVAGGVIGFTLGNSLSHSKVFQVVSNGINSRVGSSVGGFAANHGGKTIPAGLAVEAVQGLGESGGISRLVTDGIAAQVGAHAKDGAKQLGTALRTVGEGSGTIARIAKVAAPVVEQAPHTAGEVVGAGMGVKFSRWMLAKTPLVLGVGGAAVGALILSHVWNQNLNVGGN